MNKYIIIAGIVGVAGIGLYFISQQQTVETPDKNYVGYSVEECSRIQVTCVEGFQRFDDDSGCGCEVI